MTNSCRCRPSESIHGAGAYLVDVLEFLKHRAIEPIDDCVEGQHVKIDNARTLAMWPDRVRLETPGPSPARMILVRPDGYVAWATDEQEPDKREAALRRALTPVVRSPGRSATAQGRS